MKKAVIDTSTAVRYLINHALCTFFVFREKVKCERLRLRLDLGDDIFQGVIRDNGKDRSEDFFRHDGRVFGGIQKNSRFDLQSLAIPSTADGDLLSLDELH